MARDDPFSGLRLSEQTASGKIEQRLFTSQPTPAPAPPKPERPTPAPAPAKHAPASTPPVAPSKPAPVARLSSLTAPRFDLKEVPLYKASYLFTQEELEALEDLKLELRREHDSRVTKNDLIRCALHLLLEDHAANGERSYARRRVRRRGER